MLKTATLIESCQQNATQSKIFASFLLHDLQHCITNSPFTKTTRTKRTFYAHMLIYLAMYDVLSSLECCLNRLCYTWPSFFHCQCSCYHHQRRVNISVRISYDISINHSSSWNSCKKQKHTIYNFLIIHHKQKSKKIYFFDCPKSGHFMLGGTCKDVET